MASYRKISFHGKKIYIQETIIVKKNFIPKLISLSLDKEQFYFSPTSFINKKDLGVFINYKKKVYNKMKYSIHKISYECS